MSSRGQIERIYLDAAGGQRSNPSLLSLASPLMNSSWNDGLSFHHEAKSTQAAVNLAMESIGSAFGVKPENILPAHRLGNAIDYLAHKFPDAAVSKTSRKAALEKFQGQSLEVDATGRLIEFPNSGTVFFSAANQETGVIDPLVEIESVEVVRLVDASEWFGRTTRKIHGDYLLARASSWGGPQSVCFVVSTKKPIEIDKRKARALAPDTFNLLLAASAWENLGDTLSREERTLEFANKIRETLQTFPNIKIHGSENSLPHLISFDIANVDSETAAIEFDRNGISIGAGSACGAESQNSSHVLAAMEIECAGNLRISIPIEFSESELEFFLEKLPKVVKELAQTL